MIFIPFHCTHSYLESGTVVTFHFNSLTAFILVRICFRCAFRKILICDLRNLCSGSCSAINAVQDLCSRRQWTEGNNTSFFHHCNLFALSARRILGCKRSLRRRHLFRLGHFINIRRHDRRRRICSDRNNAHISGLRGIRIIVEFKLRTCFILCYLLTDTIHCLRFSRFDLIPSFSYLIIENAIFFQTICQFFGLSDSADFHIYRSRGRSCQIENGTIIRLSANADLCSWLDLCSRVNTGHAVRLIVNRSRWCIGIRSNPSKHILILRNGTVYISLFSAHSHIDIVSCFAGIIGNRDRVIIIIFPFLASP